MNPEPTRSTGTRRARPSIARAVAYLALLIPACLATGGWRHLGSVPPPPLKQIVIHNNARAGRIYPMIQAGIRKGNADLWMQAQLGVGTNDTYARQFPSTFNYRAYINLPESGDAGGIPPGGSVTITLPFYTQLQGVTEQNLGVNNDQFIDWWNGVRIYFFSGATALNAALITYNVPSGPPQSVTPLAGAVGPSCTNGPGNSRPKCDVSLLTYTIDPLPNIPFQLQEFTFASAEGPPPGGSEPKGSPVTIDTTYVNYNVSSLDSVYLPIAMGPLHNAAVPYVGTSQSVETFNANLQAFAFAGYGWPYYVPAYFTSGSQAGFPPIFGATCSLAPFSGVPGSTAYLFPKIPGTANLIVESYAGVPSSSGGAVVNPPIPPTLSSQPPNYRTFPGYAAQQCVSSGIAPYATPRLGVFGNQIAGMTGLWFRCVQNPSIGTKTCNDIRTVRKLFVDNFAKACGAAVPDEISILYAVYGWVPVTSPLYGGKQCSGGSLAGTGMTPLPEYVVANAAYCSLQYNYLTLNPTDFADVFNPYTALIHGLLASSAYAFSIDDKSSFKHVTGDGVIIAIGGTTGLENQTPSPLPTKNTIGDHCKTSL